MRDWCRKASNKWLPWGGFARSVSVLIGGTALAQGIAIAASPLLTRIYKPADFGVLQVFMSLLGLAIVGAAGRYELAVLLPEDEQSAIDILFVAALCVTFSAILVAGAVIFSRYHWLLPKSVLVLQQYLWLLPVSVLGGGLYQVLSYWAMRRDRYKQLATTKLVQVGAQIGTQLGVGVAMHGPFGLMAGDAIGRTMGSGRFLADLWRDYSGQIRAVRLRRMMRLAIRYRDYPLVSIWGAFINSSGLAIPSLFFAQYYGAQETGWFALVNRVLGFPVALIGNSIAQVYTSEAAKHSRSNPERLMYLFLKTTRRMLVLGLAPCAVFTILAPWLFQFIFGHNWREAGVYARFLAFMFYAGFINSPVQMTLVVLERQVAQFLWDAVRFVITILAIVVPHQLGMTPRSAIFSYGVAMFVMYAVHWAQSHWAIKECVNAQHAAA